MNTENADTLGKRIINTFRQTPALTEWRDVLRPLEPQRAVATFELCRDTVDDRLSIARFIQTYRTQPASTSQPRAACNTCDGEGYLRIYFERHGTEYVGLTVCRDCDGTYNPPDDEPIPPRHTGRQIAYQAYAAECLRAGRKPDPHWFERSMTLIGDKAASVARHPSTPELFDHESETEGVTS